jgi:hypothetical protein
MASLTTQEQNATNSFHTYVGYPESKFRWAIEKKKE